MANDWKKKLKRMGWTRNLVFLNQVFLCLLQANNSIILSVAWCRKGVKARKKSKLLRNLNSLIWVDSSFEKFDGFLKKTSMAVKFWALWYLILDCNQGSRLSPFLVVLHFYVSSGSFSSKGSSSPNGFYFSMVKWQKVKKCFSGRVRHDFLAHQHPEEF